MTGQPGLWSISKAENEFVVSFNQERPSPCRLRKRGQLQQHPPRYTPRVRPSLSGAAGQRRPLHLDLLCFVHDHSRISYVLVSSLLDISAKE